MDKSGLTYIGTLLNERYTQEPKNESVPVETYVIESVSNLITSLNKEAETAPTLFNDVLRSFQKKPIHSATLLRELRLIWSEKYSQKVDPFVSPEPVSESDTDEAILKRLGLTKEMLSALDSDAIEKLLKPHRKSKSSEYLVSEINEMKRKHFAKVCPGLYPEPIEIFDKVQNIIDNSPTVAHGHIWSRYFQPISAVENIEFIDRFNLFGNFQFSDSDIEDIKNRKKVAEKYQSEFKELAENNGKKSDIIALWNKGKKDKSL